MIDSLVVLLALSLALSIGLYVVLDGFDLGIGILFLFAPGKRERDIMMNSIGPVWDGNETWLVMGGTLLLAAFPLAYAALLPVLYAPLMLMLFALIFRGVAFEFRFRASRFRRLWDWTFSLGSGLAALMQGVMLGAVIDGIPASGRGYGGILFPFFSVFAVASGLGVAAFYALLGATWLILKTDGTTQAFARRAAMAALLLSAAFLALISILTPIAHPRIAHIWFSFPAMLYLAPLPLTTALLALGIWRTIRAKRDGWPFMLSVGVFLTSYAGLGVSLWPYAVPERITLWQAASAEPTLLMVGVGTAITLPFILFYLAYAHWVFRGKVSDGYEH